MSSRLAQAVAHEAKSKGLFGGKARQFYLELQELVTVREIRAIIKEKFLQHKDVTDPRAIDMLIFKGREELEVYLCLHKQRHHAITEYLDPIISCKTAFPKKPSGHSVFLDSFLQGRAPHLTGQ